MKELESHEESQCREVPQYRSGSDTTAFHTPSPTFGLLEHSPSSSSHYEEYQDKNNPAEDLPSFLLLPNDSLRSKYLKEREKLWEQLTADDCDSGIDSDGDGDNGIDSDGDGDGDIKDLQCQELPPIVFQPSGNRSPTTDNDPKAEVKVLPKEVTTTFSNNSRSSYVSPAPRQKITSNMQSTATRQEYQHGTSGNNIRARKNPSSSIIYPFEMPGSKLRLPPPSKRATADLKHHPQNTSQSHQSEKKAEKQRRSHCKSLCNKLDSKSEELDFPQLNCNDVIWGSGRQAHCHPGNVYFRFIVAKYKLHYAVGDSFNKSTIANIIAKSIQSLVPPGRLLKKIKGSKKSSRKGGWQDMGEEAMISQTRNALGHGAKEVKHQQIRNAMRDHMQRLAPP